MFDACPNQFNGERTHIRRLTDGDLPAIYDLHQREVVNQYLPYTTWTSYDDATAWLDRVKGQREVKTAEQYVIELKATQQFIGTCLVFNFDERDQSATIGYVLHPDFWGQGLMLDAIGAFVTNLSFALPIHKLKAVVEEPNLASARLLEKLGFGRAHQETTEEGLALHTWLKMV